MSDHENHQKRQRRDLGSVNPHPSTEVPSHRGTDKGLLKMTVADVDAVRAAWIELGDIGLVALRFPGCWRGAIQVVLRLMVAERICGECQTECREPGNPACYRMQGKLPTLPKVEDEE